MWDTFPVGYYDELIWRARRISYYKLQRVAPLYRGIDPLAVSLPLMRSDEVGFPKRSILINSQHELLSLCSTAIYYVYYVYKRSIASALNVSPPFSKSLRRLSKERIIEKLCRQKQRRPIWFVIRTVFLYSIRYISEFNEPNYWIIVNQLHEIIILDFIPIFQKIVENILRSN